MESMTKMCYICKLGWLDDESTPVLHNREGIWLCKLCLDVIDSRAKKSQAGWNFDWDDWQDAGGES